MASQWPVRRATAFYVRFYLGVTGITNWDTEIRKDGGAFTDCINELAEIGTTGFYWILLTAAEMTADRIELNCQSVSIGAVGIVIDTIDLDDITNSVPFPADVSISQG